jgi:uridine monophosphate synthetase
MLDNLVLELFAKQMIKFGEFTLKSGKPSYIYADIRSVISQPKLFRWVCELLASKLTMLKFDFICGVPYSALTFASAISYANQMPQLLTRKEAKTYGTKKMVEGSFTPGQTVVILEDVVTTGSSVLSTIALLQEQGLVVKDVVCLIERNQGGREQLLAQGYSLTSVLDLYQIIDILFNSNKITAAMKEQALALIEV